MDRGWGCAVARGLGEGGGTVGSAWGGGGGITMMIRRGQEI